MDKLKKCPFCGGEAKLYDSVEFGSFIYCTNSDCDIHPMTGNDTETEEVIKIWNTRYTDDTEE